MRTNGIRDEDDDVGVKSEEATRLLLRTSVRSPTRTPTALLQWENMAHVEWDPAMQNGGAEFPLASPSPFLIHTRMAATKKTLAFDSLSLLMATFAEVQRDAHTDAEYGGDDLSAVVIIGVGRRFL